jgi:serine/threonine protein kinase
MRNSAKDQVSFWTCWFLGLKKAKIRHPNIVGMKEGVLTENNLYIVMEFVHGLSLFDHILQVRTYAGGFWFLLVVFGSHALAEQDARNTIKCLLGAVCYLHENGIAHRDLKPENIIVSDGAGKKTCVWLSFFFHVLLQKVRRC